MRGVQANDWSREGSHKKQTTPVVAKKEIVRKKRTARRQAGRCRKNRIQGQEREWAGRESKVGVSFELRGDRKSEETEGMIGDPELAPIRSRYKFTAFGLSGSCCSVPTTFFPSFLSRHLRFFSFFFLFFPLTQDHRLKSSLTRYLSYTESTALAIPMCVSRVLDRF